VRTTGQDGRRRGESSWVLEHPHPLLLSMVGEVCLSKDVRVGSLSILFRLELLC
jgi:hypothetical protein